MVLVYRLSGFRFRVVGSSGESIGSEIRRNLRWWYQLRPNVIAENQILAIHVMQRDGLRTRAFVEDGRKSGRDDLTDGRVGGEASAGQF